MRSQTTYPNTLKDEHKFIPSRLYRLFVASLWSRNMEQLNVFDCSNVLIASFFTDDQGCAHENREHTLSYLCSGELEIEERGKITVLHPGECAFMRRDNRIGRKTL